MACYYYLVHFVGLVCNLYWEEGSCWGGVELIREDDQLQKANPVHYIPTESYDKPKRQVSVSYRIIKTQQRERRQTRHSRTLQQGICSSH